MPDTEQKTIPELYKSAIRTVTIVFGSLFNDIYVRKYAPDGSVITGSKRRVPIIFSPKEQYFTWIYNTMRRPDNGTKVGVSLPRLSYDLVGIAPDQQRQIPPYLYHSGAPNMNADSPYANRELSPAAYSFNFTLSIWSNDMDSSIQILEAILPYFKPEVSVKVKEQDTLPIINDIHVVFNSMSKQDNYTEGYEVNRFIQWDLEFTMYSNIWTPTVSEGKLITEIFIDLNDDRQIPRTIEEQEEEENKCMYGIDEDEHHKPVGYTPPDDDDNCMYNKPNEWHEEIK